MFCVVRTEQHTNKKTFDWVARTAWKMKGGSNEGVRKGAFWCV